jgi:hypothetical protein
LALQQPEAEAPQTACGRVDDPASRRAAEQSALRSMAEEAGRGALQQPGAEAAQWYSPAEPELLELLKIKCESCYVDGTQEG